MATITKILISRDNIQKVTDPSEAKNQLEALFKRSRSSRLVER